MIKFALIRNEHNRQNKSKYHRNLGAGLVLFILSFFLLYTSMIYADEADTYKLVIDDEKMSDEIVCTIKPGNIYVPLTQIEKKLNLEIQKNTATGSLTLIHQKDTLILAAPEAKWGYLNGESHILNQSGFEKNGIFYIASSTLSDTFHFNIEVITDKKWLRIMTHNDVLPTDKLIQKLEQPAVEVKKEISSQENNPSKNSTEPVTKNIPKTAAEKVASSKIVYLTFDDGINKKNTPIILDILKQNNVKATFFIVGNTIKKNTDILKRIASEGHTIGNHSFSHRRDIIYSSSDKFKEELNKTSSLIKEVTGIEPKLFRPPYGSKLVLSGKYKEYLKGYKTVYWNIDGKDSQIKDIKGAEIAAGVISQLKKHPMAIILLHDTHSENLIALPIILKYLKDNGYELRTIDKDKPLRYTYNN